jgi:hypothetical protein
MRSVIILGMLREFSGIVLREAARMGSTPGATCGWSEGRSWWLLV